MTMKFKTDIAGVSLIEVMVAVVVLTMGLVGMAALQGLGTQFGNRAYYRSQAIVQAYDMIDRLRANPHGAAAGNYVQDPMPSTSEDCAAVDAQCSASQTAIYDLVSWNTVNGNLLPTGAGSITSVGNVFTVQLTWQEDDDDDGVAETQVYQMSARL